ncbi:MAG: putative toxin-antitoxin system toxin component, PIN family [Flavobacteriia bacterium]|nr:putative toxin-antitoxin system toxin component, PIN family [Flavobacteriia bacterium]
MRLVIDTNIFIISLIGKGSPKLMDWMADKKFKILFSNESYSELIEVLKRPKFNKLFTEKKILELLELLDVIMEKVKIRTNTDICRDKKDNFLLNLSKDGKADYLITEDLDLLEIKEFNKTKIVKYKEFIKLVFIEK